MTLYSSYDDIIAKCTQNNQVVSIPFFKYDFASLAAGNFFSTWLQPGYPGAGVNPAASPGTAYHNADGSIWLPDDESHTKFLLSVEVFSGYPGAIIIYDRLVSVSGIPLNSTGVKTVNTAALPRYADGLGNEVWLEITSAGFGGSAPVVTLNSYTDEDDNAGQSGIASTFNTTTNPVGTLHKLPLSVDDRGVKAVASIQVNTAGSGPQCNVLMVHPLVALPYGQANSAAGDNIRGLPGFIPILDGACLGIAFGVNAQSAPGIKAGILNIGWV